MHFAKRLVKQRLGVLQIGGVEASVNQPYIWASLARLSITYLFLEPDPVMQPE
jgi:hypothetical protein